MIPIRWALPIGLAVAIPWLALMVLGLAWLWDRGGVLWWVAGAGVVTVGSWLLVRWLRHQPPPPAVAAPEHWGDRERSAWTLIEERAEHIEPADFPLDERLHHRLLELGMDIVRSVGRAEYPQADEPLLEATIPQLLAMTEKVARDVRELCQRVPLSERLTLAQWYGLRHLKHLSAAHDVYRLGRLMFNPVGALAAELRDQVQGQVLTATRSEAIRWLLQAYVRATGRYAIDLFAGFAVDMEGAPARVLIAGRAGSDRRVLLSVLTDGGDSTAGARVADDLLPDTVFSVSGLDAPDLRVADLVLVTSAATRAARDLEAALIARCAGESIPTLLVLTQVDHLRPAREWAPPYDLVEPAGAKAKSIVLAREHVARELEITPDRVIPVAVTTVPAFNVEDGLLPVLGEVLRTEGAACRMRRTARERRGWGHAVRQLGQTITRSGE